MNLIVAKLRSLRRRRQRELTAFSAIRCSRRSTRRLNKFSRRFSQTSHTEQDKSDFRQLFRDCCQRRGIVTRDQRLLERCDDVYKACGLSVVRPAELLDGRRTTSRTRVPTFRWQAPIGSSASESIGRGQTC